LVFVAQRHDLTKVVHESYILLMICLLFLSFWKSLCDVHLLLNKKCLYSL